MVQVNGILNMDMWVARSPAAGVTVWRHICGIELSSTLELCTTLTVAGVTVEIFHGDTLEDILGWNGTTLQDIADSMSTVADMDDYDNEHVAELRNLVRASGRRS